MSHGVSCHNGSLKKNYLLEPSIGHILDVSVNANSFPVQCSVIASAALTRDRVFYFLPWKKKFYSLNFHVIDIKHRFRFSRLLYCQKTIVLKSIFLHNSWIGQQYQYLKYVHDNPVANKNITLGQVVTNFTGQVVTSCSCVCACVHARVCVCYNPYSYTPCIIGNYGYVCLYF